MGKREELKERICAWCEQPFQPRKSDQRFCKRGCNNAFHNDKLKLRTSPSNRLMHEAGMSKGTIGAVGELVVCVDLFRQGYEVFRAQSQSCSCDLVALKDGRCLRVEVKSGYRLTNGEIHHGVVKQGYYDMLAVVVDSEVVYFK